MTLERIFTEVFSIPEEAISGALTLREISSWDSMSHMMLIARIETEFVIEFTGDEIADFRSVNDIREALARRGK